MKKDVFQDVEMDKELGQFLTPEPIVDYMVISAIREFVKSHKVERPLQILDFACGTSRFMLGVAEFCEANSMDYAMWNIDCDSKMTEMTIHHAILYKLPAVVLLGNTLTNEIQRGWSVKDGAVSELSDVNLRLDVDFDIVMGNPPYAGISSNASWRREGKKRVPTFIGKLLDDYYKVDGQPLGERKLWLQDDYVKFIRFGQWRIEREFILRR